MTPEEKNAKEAQLAQLFTPGTPISIQELLAGRIAEIRKVFDSVFQAGQHAAIYGERGVGKTSLAKVVLKILTAAPEGEEPLVKFAHHVNCDRADTFASLWRKVFNQITTTYQGTGFGNEDIRVQGQSLAAVLNEKSGPADIVTPLRTLPKSVIIFDEFDTLGNRNVTGLFADCMKALSDFEVDATVVIVGVAESIAQLISQHASIERCLTQIHMPPMLPKELEDIITTRYPRAQMEFDAEVPKNIARLSQGFPHYTHALGLYSGRAALDRDSTVVEKSDIRTAIAAVVQNTSAMAKERYMTAIQSSHKDNLYEQVLLACALAEPDEFGYFSPPDVRNPMTTIMGKAYDIPSFARHLSSFCTEERGMALQRKGKKHSYRYRFSNPLLRPYVYLRGIQNGKVPQKYQPL